MPSSGYNTPHIPPHSAEAETALLGALLISSNAMYEVVDAVRSEAFYYPQNAHVYDAMLSLYEAGQPIDIVTVSQKLKDREQLAAIGGNAYLTELTSKSASPASAKHYADIVQSKFILRSLIDTGAHITQLGFDEARDIASIIDEAESTIFSISQAPTLRKFTAIKEQLAEAWERLEKLNKNDGALRGVPSGFSAIDNKLSGFQESDLIIIAARPSMGKTALALDIARQAAVKHGVPVGIFSLEMSAQQLTDRMLAAEARVDAWKLRTGKLKSDEDFANLQRALETLSEAPIYIDDQPGATMLTMRSVARRLKLERDLGLIIVDYLQLITPSESRTDSLVQQVTEISRALKGMARELKVPVIALSQLSRAVEQRGGKPRLSDLRDSGSIEQDADVVMFIHREDMMGNRTGNEKNGVAEILIEKHRNGPVGKVELRFDDEKTTFLPLEKSDFGDFVSETEVSGEAPF
jgi:replicative DNA helicase